MWSETSYSSSLMTANSTVRPMSEPQGAVPQLTYRGPLPGTTEVLLIRHGRSADVVPGTPESQRSRPPRGRASAGTGARRPAGEQADRRGLRLSPRARDRDRAAARRRAWPVRRPSSRTSRRCCSATGARASSAAAAAIGDPEFLAAMATGRWDAIPGAERDEDLRGAGHRRRSLGFGAAHIDQTIAVVSHGGAINACLAGLLGSTARTSRRSRTRASRPCSCATGAPARLVTMNDCNHIYDPVLRAAYACISRR